MKAMILAAGDGKRMGKLTVNTPKPLLKIDQYSLVEHHLFRLSKHGFTDIIINVRYLAEQIQTTLGDGSRYGVNITYSVETEDLEVAGGISNALPLLGTAPFLLISADIWTDYPLYNLKQHTPEQAHMVFVPIVPPPGSTAYTVTDYRLKLAQPGERTWTYGNIGVFNPQLFADVPTSFCKFRHVLDATLQANKPISAEGYPGRWFNINSPTKLEQLRQSLLQPIT